MLLSETVKIIPKARSITYYKNKGYIFNSGEEIEVKVEDLPKSSRVKVKVKCDYCPKSFEKT